MIGQSEKSGIEIESEYQLTGHPVHQAIKMDHPKLHMHKRLHEWGIMSDPFLQDASQTGVESFDGAFLFQYITTYCY